MSATWAAGSSSEQSYAFTGVTVAPLTMMSWLRSTGDKTVGGSYNVVMLGDASSTSDYWKIETTTDGTAGQIKGAIADTNVIHLDSGVVINQDQWYNAILVERPTGTVHEFYLDGISKASSGTSRTPDNVDTVGIGREIDSTADDSWTGQLNFTCIWNVALDTDEIISLANGAHPLTIRPTALKTCVETLSNTLAYDWIAQRTFTRVGLTAYTGPPAPVSRLPAANPVIITMAGGGPTITPIPPKLHNSDRQFSTITAHRLGGVLS